MKTISDTAMQAITQGRAIVAGALELVPRAFVYDYETVNTVDLDAVDNATTDASLAASVGVTLTGFDPNDVLRVTQPLGGTFTAWNYQGGLSGRWVNDFDVILDNVLSAHWRISENGTESGGGLRFPPHYLTAASARAGFGMHFLTGAEEYTFYIHDDNSDNSGGVSILVEKRLGGAEAEPDPIRVWGGFGPLEIDGETYQGIGDRGFVQRTAGAIGGVAQGLLLGLSGLDPETLGLLEGDEIKGASAVIRRLIFDQDGQSLIGVGVFDRGRVDTVETSETIGGKASINLAIETAARGLGSSGARMRSDSDQRLINPSDGYFRNTAYAGEKMLYWGGRKPHRTGGLGDAVGAVFGGRMSPTGVG